MFCLKLEMKTPVVLSLLAFVLLANASTSLRLPWLRQHLAVPKSLSSKNITAQWFSQELDHFNAQNVNTWQQRYFVNDEFWNPDLGGPIFLMVGGEGAIDAGYVSGLEMAVWAQKFGALMFALEHRFYGESQPFADQTTENFAFLSSQQALADLANFIQTMKLEYYAEDAPVVTFGGSYPGNLAAWFRIKYPHLTIGSIASSAPVQATLDFYQYLDVVDASLDDYASPTCVNLISNATSIIESMLLTSEGQTQLQLLFDTCSPLNNELDIATFMSNLMGNWMGTVQYNDELGNPIDLEYLCDIMGNASTPLQGYVKVNSVFQGTQCMLVSYNETIAQLLSTVPVTQGVGPRSWTYQTCAEFGYFQSTDSENQPFGNLVPLSYYIQMCDDLGWGFGVRIEETLNFYGGNQPTGSSKVVFVNGSIDPWHALSVTHSIGKHITAIVIDGTAHCADMFPDSPRDPPGLAQAHAEIASTIRGWLDA